MRRSLETALSELVGLTCWGVVAGVGNGSMATLHIGKQIERLPPLTNANLPDELRAYQGQFCLFVKGCAWRLENGSAIVCASTDSESKIGLSLSRTLTGTSLTAAELRNWAGDLNVTFDEQYVLRLFCDQTEEGIDNYALRSPLGWIKIGPNSVESESPA